MNKRKFKVLSIDFDFFQKVCKDTILECYPDGHDLPTKLSCIVWGSRYAFQKEKLLNVEADVENIEKIKDIISHMRYYSPVMICNSHKYCYNFISQNYDSNIYDGVELVNIDMHHDLFNDNPELDCGNWISHVMEKFPCEVSWICNSISKDVYGIDNKRFALIKEDFSDIYDETFDALFLCRSDAWLPPHLDKNFDDLFQYICENFDSIIKDKNIAIPRDVFVDGVVNDIKTAVYV